MAILLVVAIVAAILVIAVNVFRCTPAGRRWRLSNMRGREAWIEVARTNACYVGDALHRDLVSSYWGICQNVVLDHVNGGWTVELVPRQRMQRPEVADLNEYMERTYGLRAFVLDDDEDAAAPDRRYGRLRVVPCGLYRSWRLKQFFFYSLPTCAGVGLDDLVGRDDQDTTSLYGR